MSQDTVSATAEKICRALLGDARKVDCDIIESHVRELIAEMGEAASQPGNGNAHVREFEEWVKQTGALPWGGSWMAEVSSIIERAAQGAQTEAELEEAQREVDSMRYQRDAWRVDAERYRFLRNKARSVDWSTSHEAEGCTITARWCRVMPDEMDQDIDAAMQRGIDSGRTTGGHTGGEQKA